ncbi:hypothetical protein [[Phormidium] sp. ETS-05]|nr:hypothetical protein [[Phormidium] sp. ETS-05]
MIISYQLILDRWQGGDSDRDRPGPVISLKCVSPPMVPLASPATTRPVKY